MSKAIAGIGLIAGCTLLGFAALAAMSDQPRLATLPTPDVDQSDANISFVASDNREMAEAIIAARATLPLFLKAYADGRLDHANPTVKVGVQGVDMVENIWVTDFRSVDDVLYTGLLANDPVNLPGMAIGNRITFDEGHITDWSFIADDKGYGFYSVRALVPTMDEEQAAGINAFLAQDPLPTDWQ